MGVGVAQTAALARAYAAVEGVQRDPREALAQADAVLRDVPRGTDPDARATAQRAAGLAMHELDDVPAAVARLRSAVRAADGGASPHVRAWCRLSYAFVLSAAGRDAAALAQIAEALPHLGGLDRGRARSQRGVVLHRLGRYDEARRDYAAAAAAARRHGDVLGQARALNNLGVVRAHLGEAQGARADLQRAVEAFDDLGLDVAAADARWNLAYVQAKSGDLTAALTSFAAVDAEHRRLGLQRPDLLLDRLEVLLAIPLVAEARSLAAAAVDELARLGLHGDEAVALLGLSRAALLAGQLRDATDTARRAGDLFRQQGRDRFTALAAQVELHARYEAGERSLSLAQASSVVAADLEAMGWRAPSLHAHLDAARLFTDVDEPERALDELSHAAGARRGGTATTRVLAWYAEGLRRRLCGDAPAALRALRRGLAELDAYRASIGSTDMRVGTGSHGIALAREGLDISLSGGRPGQVLAWSERSRAGALRVTSARPPDDSELAETLTALRMASAELELETPGSDAARRLARRRDQLEEMVRDRARIASTPGGPSRGGQSVLGVPSVAAVADCLGSASLVELLEHKGGLHAVVVRRGRARLIGLGSMGEVAESMRRLGFALRRVGAADGSSVTTQAALTALHRLAQRIDAMLLGPLRRHVGDDEVVLVPTGALHAAPWSLLPTLRGRPLTIAPSAALYIRAAKQPPRSAEHRLLVAGPGLPGARTEVGLIQAQMPGVAVLTDEQATVAAAMRAMDGACLVHVAAHGHFRSDNPLFSSLRLADGPLTVYDLERLAVPPQTVVLSACGSGLSAVRPGDELMGLSASLLGMGTRALLAPVTDMDDAGATAFMAMVHRALWEGVAPASALARAQERVMGDGPVSLAAAGGFSCFGAGLEVSVRQDVRRLAGHQCTVRCCCERGHDLPEGNQPAPFVAHRHP